MAALLLPFGALAVALAVGSLTAMAGAFAGDRAVYFVVLPGLAALALITALTRTEPLRFMVLSLMAVLPLINILVPPGRFNLTVFDVGAVVLALGFLLRKMFANQSFETQLFPARSLAVMWLLLAPCAVLARYPVESTVDMVLLFSAYVFFLFLVQELFRPGGLERLTGLLSFAVIVIVAGLCVDHFLHINLSMRGTNFNQVTKSGGLTIWRAGGFFQDPQKAGAFLAASMGFLLVLGVRGRFRGTWLQALLWLALLVGVPGLLMTVSRAAFSAFVAVSAIALLLLSRVPVLLRMLGIGVLVMLMAGVFLVPDKLLSWLPAELAARMSASQSELLMRKVIWFDTWDMFANQPLTGIGFGAFQHYLLDTRPLVFSYYGIGEDVGTIYVPDQPESGYFKILYESGILGSLAALILVVETVRRACVGMLRHRANDAARTEIAAALAGLIASGFTFVTLFTTGDPRILVLLLMVMAVIWRHTLPDPSAKVAA